ncbi:MAG: glycoside hydrolase family 3 N-terminal domain-containing protein [bacterium]
MKQKVGFLFIVGFYGKDIPDWLKGFSQEFGLGGVIIYNRNFNNIDNLSGLILRIKNELSPLLICVDQEGGKKRRLDFEPYDAPFDMAKKFGLGGIYDVYKVSARRLARLGFNVNFAPVCDIAENGSYIGKRAFGCDAFEVANAVRASVYGIKAGGIIPVAKHFPGLGRSKTDPHMDLPELELSIEQLLKWELIPFKEAISAGARFIMTTHVVLKQLENMPVTFSNIAINFLRSSLKHDGIVLTDDILMGALKGYSLEDRIRLSLTAGHDMVLISNGDERLFDIVCRLENNLIADKIWRVYMLKKEVMDGEKRS